MRKTDVVIVVVLLALLAAALVYIPALGRSIRQARVINAINQLKVSYRDLSKGGAITNRSDRARVFAFTNRFTIGGTNYDCVLAADSWDDRGANNLLAITTNEALLFIGKSGPVPLIGWRLPAGY